MYHYSQSERTVSCNTDGAPWQRAVERADENGRLTSIRYLDSDGQPATDERGISHGEWAWNVEFALVEQVGPHTGSDGEPIAIGRGRFGMRNAFDPDGYVASQTALGPDGEPAADDEGIATRTYTRRDGQLTAVSYFGPDGSPAVTASGYHSLILENGRNDLPVRYSWMDATGTPTMITHGRASVTIERDDAGRALGAACFDAEGQPILCSWAATFQSDTIRCHRVRDNRGMGHARSERMCFGTDGELRDSQVGWARMVRRQRGRDAVEVTFFDAAGQPAETVYGGTRYTDVREAPRRLYRWYGPDGESRAGRDTGCHLVVVETRDSEIVRTCLSGAEQPTPFKGTGCFSTREVLGASGQQERHDCLDGEGAPMIEQSGTASSILVYDLHGNLVELRTLGPHGELMERRGKAREVRAHDKLGRMVEVITYDAAGGRVFHMQREYDVRGNLTKSRYLPTGFGPEIEEQAVYSAWNVEGRTVRMWRLDGNGEPVADPQGVHDIRIEYDAAGLARTDRYFGVDGRPVPSGGCHRAVRHSDALGRPIRKTCFDAAGDPAPNGMHHGASRVEHTYDSRGNKVGTSLFDTADKPFAVGPVHEVRWVYDAEGRELEVRFVGVDGEPVVNSAGFLEPPGNWSRRTRTLDEAGRLVEERYFRPDGEPGSGPQAWSRTVLVYDTWGHVVEQRWFSSDGGATPNENGCARQIRRLSPVGDLLDDRCEGG